MPRPGECLWHDGWVSPADIREGKKVWGGHTPSHNPVYWTGSALPIIEGTRMLMYQDCPMVSNFGGFWVIEIHEDATWHYHKEA